MAFCKTFYSACVAAMEKYALPWWGQRQWGNGAMLPQWVAMMGSARSLVGGWSRVCSVGHLFVISLSEPKGAQLKTSWLHIFLLIAHCSVLISFDRRTIWYCTKGSSSVEFNDGRFYRDQLHFINCRQKLQSAAGLTFPSLNHFISERISEGVENIENFLRPGKDLFVQSTRCNKRSIPSCCTIQLFRRKLQKSKLDFREIESCRCFSKDKERIMKSQSKRVYFMWKTICSLVIDNYRRRWDDVYVLWFPQGRLPATIKSNLED